MNLILQNRYIYGSRPQVITRLRAYPLDSTSIPRKPNLIYSLVYGYFARKKKLYNYFVIFADPIGSLYIEFFGTNNYLHQTNDFFVFCLNGSLIKSEHCSKP